MEQGQDFIDKNKHRSPWLRSAVIISSVMLVMLTVDSVWLVKSDSWLEPLRPDMGVSAWPLWIGGIAGAFIGAIAGLSMALNQFNKYRKNLK
jgi:hypothetical protein